MESYSILNDFGGVSPNMNQLYQEIDDEINILTKPYGGNIDGDSITLGFESSISPSEKSALDNVVSNHVPVFIIETSKQFTILPKKNNYKHTRFVRIATDVFPGSTYAKAKSISYMGSGVTSYDIQIYDKTNKQVLLNTNLTNSTESIQDLGELTNIPSSSSQLEISIRKNGTKSSKMYIENVIIYYI